MFAILYVVFTRVFTLGKDVPHYPVYLLLGIVIWNFFQEMTTRSITAIVDRGSLLRKIGIPRWLIIFSSSVSAVINLLLNLVVVVVFLLINHVDLLSTSLWLPLILLEVYIFSAGLALLLSAAYVKFRDISYIWEVLLQAAFYLTPIIYPLERITSVSFQKLIMLNPMAQAIQDARYSIVTHQTATIYSVFEGGWYAFIPFLIVIATFVYGVYYFRKESKFFAENI